MTLSRKAALGLAGAAAAVVLGTAGVAAATAPSPSPTVSAAPTPRADPKADPKADPGARHRLPARALHGEWVVRGKDGRTVTMTGVRGEVTAVSATAVTVRAADGFTAAYAVTADTRVRGAGADSVADIDVGARVVMIGTKSGDARTARTVLVRK